LRIAGGRLTLFSNGAIYLAYKHSNGIPRMINQLCDRALVYGYADRSPVIDAALMTLVIEDRRSGGLLQNFVEKTEDVTPISGRQGS
jgi:general secretion pathway protein A